MPEETPMPPAEMPMPEAPVMPPQDGGDVMISMPRTTLQSMLEIVSQLAIGLEQLTQSVDQQAAGAQAPVAPEAPVPPVTAGDEEFLNSMAQEASVGR
jgi:hypothetical protein